jgi:hypothetical protein
VGDGQLEARVYIQPPPDGIWDFDFTAEAPTGIVLQVFTRIPAELKWNTTAELKGVRVHASNNNLVVMLDTATHGEALDLSETPLQAVRR